MADRLSLSLLLIAAACSGSSHHGPADAPAADAAPSDAAPVADAADCTFGDPTAPLQLALFYNQAQGGIAPLTDMTQVPLVVPDQGGYVLYVDVHAYNLASCTLKLTTVMRDVCSNAIVVFETRTAMFKHYSDGWAIPVTVASEGTIDACPPVGATRDINDQPYRIEVTAEDPLGRQAQAAVTIVPVCNGDTICECECNKDYTLGGACPAPNSGSGCP